MSARWVAIDRESGVPPGFPVIEPGPPVVICEEDVYIGVVGPFESEEKGRSVEGHGHQEYSNPKYSVHSPSMTRLAKSA